MSSCHMLRLRRLSLGFVCAASLNPTYTYGRQGSPSPVSATTDICIMIIMRMMMIPACMTVSVFERVLYSCAVLLSLLYAVSRICDAIFGCQSRGLWSAIFIS